MVSNFIINLCAGLVALALTLFAAQARAATGPLPEGPAVAPPASMIEARAIHFRNSCSASIETAIRYKTTDGGWRVTPWIRLAPAETRQVGWTRAETFFSAVRRIAGAETEPETPRSGIWTLVPGDDAPTAFALRRLGPRMQGDVTQIFFCPR